MSYEFLKVLYSWFISGFECWEIQQWLQSLTMFNKDHKGKWKFIIDESS